MSEKRSNFPLPLSSVTGAATRKPAAPAPVATPQTATQNARSNSQAGPRPAAQGQSRSAGRGAGPASRCRRWRAPT
jgi:protein-L-isoaspartate(D-aspartate) O-methyltransferase